MNLITYRAMLICFVMVTLAGCASPNSEEYSPLGSDILDRQNVVYRLKELKKQNDKIIDSLDRIEKALPPKHATGAIPPKWLLEKKDEIR